jgi:hypothetical protein
METIPIEQGEHAVSATNTASQYPMGIFGLLPENVTADWVGPVIADELGPPIQFDAPWVSKNPLTAGAIIN